MATNPILGRDIYLALAAVGWADGRLTAEAADAIVRTALEEGLDFEDVAAIEEATKNPVPLGEIDWKHMSKADRLYVYAVAAWIAELDGTLSPEEQKALAQLGDALKLPDKPRQHANAIMREVAALGDKPERFDLMSLRRTLDARLEAARQQRLDVFMKSAKS
jgi:uncharacterized membrane protein YebE (DUF533 family)